jgi:hypothetical protein
MWGGGAGSHSISPVGGGGRKGGGGNRRSSLDYQDYMEKPDHSHMVSDRASNYFVTGEDNLKLGSIPSDTVRLFLLTYIRIGSTLKQNKKQPVK